MQPDRAMIDGLLWYMESAIDCFRRSRRQPDLRRLAVIDTGEAVVRLAEEILRADFRDDYRQYRETDRRRPASGVWIDRLCESCQSHAIHDSLVWDGLRTMYSEYRNPAVHQMATPDVAAVEKFLRLTLVALESAGVPWPRCPRGLLPVYEFQAEDDNGAVFGVRNTELRVTLTEYRSEKLGFSILRDGSWQSSPEEDQFKSWYPGRRVWISVESMRKRALDDDAAIVRNIRGWRRVWVDSREKKWGVSANVRWRWASRPEPIDEGRVFSEEVVIATTKDRRDESVQSFVHVLGERPFCIMAQGPPQEYECRRAVIERVAKSFRFI